MTLEVERDAAKAPGAVDIVRLLKREFGVELKDVKSVEREFGSRKVFVKLAGEEVFGKVLAGVFDLELEGGVTKVSVSTSGLGLKLLRVRNLPTELPAGELKRVLGEFGRVLDMKMECYGEKSGLAGVLTGVRLVRMEPDRHVPNFVTVGTVTAYVEYFGQPKTCSVCGSTAHLRAACDQRGTYASRLRARRQSRADAGVDTDLAAGVTSPSPADDKAGETIGATPRTEDVEKLSAEEDAILEKAKAALELAKTNGFKEPKCVTPLNFVVNAASLTEGWEYVPPEVQSVQQEDGGGILDDVSETLSDAASDANEVFTPTTEAALNQEAVWEKAKSGARSTRRGGKPGVVNGGRRPLTEQQKMAKIKQQVNVGRPVNKRTLSNLSGNQAQKRALTNNKNVVQNSDS